MASAARVVFLVLIVATDGAMTTHSLVPEQAAQSCSVETKNGLEPQRLLIRPSPTVLQSIPILNVDRDGDRHAHRHSLATDDCRLELPLANRPEPSIGNHFRWPR